MLRVLRKISVLVKRKFASLHRSRASELVRADKVACKLKVRSGHLYYRLLLSTTLLLLLLLISCFAETLTARDPMAQVFPSLQPPSFEHLAGTDRYGRDLLVRTLVAIRNSFRAVLILITCSAFIGTLTGLCAAYGRGKIAMLIMRVADLCLAFPSLIIALVSASLFRGGSVGAIAALTLSNWPKYARLVYVKASSLINSDYVAAAKMAGSNARQIMRRHLLPNTGSIILVTALTDFGTLILELASLSFLGIGIQAPTPELGNMLSNARTMLQTYPWLTVVPATAIFVSVSLLNLCGEAARDYFNYKNKF